MSLQSQCNKKKQKKQRQKNKNFNVIYQTWTCDMHCMYLAEAIIKWKNNWNDSTGQHHELLSHPETLNKIVLLKVFSFLIATSLYFSQYVHDYGRLLHLRKRISLLLSLCRWIPHVDDVASRDDIWWGFMAKISTYFSTFDYFWGGSFFLSFFVWLFDEMKWLRWFGWRKKARIYEYISIFSEPLWCRWNPGGNLETRREDVQNDMHEDGAAAPVTVRSGKKKKNVFRKWQSDWQIDGSHSPAPFCTGLSQGRDLSEAEGGEGPKQPAGKRGKCRTIPKT